MGLEEGYSIHLINKNLGEDEGRIKRKKDESYLEIGGKSIPLNIAISHGMMGDNDVRKIARTVSKQTGKSQEEIYKELIKKSNLRMERIPSSLERAIIPIIILLSVGLIILILPQTKLLTGYAISNIPNTTSNIGIFICIVGIIGLLHYRNRCKR